MWPAHTSRTIVHLLLPLVFYPHIPRNTMQKKIENLHPKAQENKSKGEQLFKKKRYTKALEHFDIALKHEPKSGCLFFNKGKVYLELGQYAYAMIAFEKAEFFDPNINISAQKERILHLSKNVPVSALEQIVRPVEEYLHEDICSLSYRKKFKELCLKHKNIKNLSYIEQVNSMIALMEFAFTYYDPKQSPMPFVNSEFVADTESGQVLRLKKLEGTIRYFLPSLTFPYSTSVNEYGLTICHNLIDDVFLQDSIVILRMLFETIHKLPRKERADLIEKLPWGTNSWYFLEFCSTFFQTNEDQPIIFVGSENALEAHFYNALKNETCLVKAVIPQLLSQDIRQLYRFFLSVKENLLHSNHSIEVVDELPNLKNLLWYFKHSYQLVRLTALVPRDKSVPLILANHSKNQDLELTPLAKLYMLSYDDSFTDSLKSKLAFIRRIQLIGEVFTKRSWGSQLDSLELIDSEILAEIRNGLCHPEDLKSMKFLNDLENNSEKLRKLYAEFGGLRSEIYNLIEKRQGKLAPWPDTSTPFKTWQQPVSFYWDSVKQYYDISSFNLTAYKSNRLLIEQFQFEALLKVLNPKAPHFKYLCKLIKGEYAFNELPKNEIIKSSLLPNTKEGPVVKIFKKALTKHKALRAEESKKISHQNKAQREAIKNNTIQHMTLHFPCTRQLGRDAVEQLRTEKSGEVDLEYILTVLKSRVSLLKLLFMNCGINLDKKSISCIKDIQSVVVDDIEMQLAVAYLISQVVSILSKLQKHKYLTALHPELLARLPEFKSLRNALEHSDPVIDSKDISYIHMKSKVNLLMGTVTHELITTFYNSIMTANHQLLHAVQSDDEVGDTCALNVSSLIYPCSPTIKVAQVNPFKFFSSEQSSEFSKDEGYDLNNEDDSSLSQSLT